MIAANGNETLVQNRALKRSNRVTFLDNRTLRIDSQTNNQKTSFRIDVIALKLKPSRSYALAWPWLIGAILMLGILLAEVSGSFIFPDSGSWQSILVKVALGVLGVVCLVLFFKLSHGKYVFKSRHAKVPLLDIWTGQPSGKAVRAFVQLLEQRIENAYNHMELTKEQQITGEIKMLRRLVEENIIQNADYEPARARLMKKF